MLAPLEPFVEINPKDAKKIHIHDQSEVKISTKSGTTKAIARITERVLPGVIFIPFLPVQESGKTLTTEDPRAKIPELNAAICQVKGTGENKGEQ